MQNVATEICYWQFRDRELSDPELIDKLVLSMCDSLAIPYPHFKFHLLINELVSNAIDHGVLCLNSHLKDSSSGFERYLIERSRRLRDQASGSVSLSAEWVEGSLLRISVQDSGAGFDVDSCYDNGGVSDKDRLLKLYGRGLVIVRGLCKSVEHIEPGNCTVVEFDFAAV